MSMLRINIPVSDERTLRITAYEAYYREPPKAFITVNPGGSCVELDTRLLVEAAQKIVDHIKLDGVRIDRAHLTLG